MLTPHCTITPKGGANSYPRCSVATPTSEAQILVQIGDGLDPAEIILKREVLVGSVRVFVGQAETDQDARHFEGVVHLRDEGDGAAFADEHGFFAEALLQRRLGNMENRVVIGATQGLPELSVSNLQ